MVCIWRTGENQSSEDCSGIVGPIFYALRPENLGVRFQPELEDFPWKGTGHLPKKKCSEDPFLNC